MARGKRSLHYSPGAEDRRPHGFAPRRSPSPFQSERTGTSDKRRKIENDFYRPEENARTQDDVPHSCRRIENDFYRPDRIVHTREDAPQSHNTSRTRYERSQANSRSQRAPDYLSDTANLSRKIHDLSRLLAHPGSRMPADVRQEKERELEGLLVDQRRQAKQARKQKVYNHPNVGRYHFVRFMERKKAEKNLKTLLKKQQQLGEAVGEHTGMLTKEIHDAEVDVNYTRYAPLEEKYISLFPGTSSRRQKRVEQDVQDGILGNASGQKPPLWYDIERSMKDGTLEDMRIGLLDISGSGEESKQLVEVGGKALALERKANGQTLKHRRSWMDDEIPAEDLDRDMSDEGGASLSDGAGGFFE